MTNSDSCKWAYVVFLLCVTTAVHSQTFTTLVNFNGNNGSAPMPAGSLTQGTDGNLYGTAKFGGVSNSGTVFKLSPAGTLTTLYSFCAQMQCADGANPNVGLVLATDGNFYGTTYSGGAIGAGVIFKITPRGKMSVLHIFAGSPTDGANPSAALVQGSDGHLYGTTYGGGVFGYGTTFKITRSGALTILHNFDSVDGARPGAALIQASDGNFYGTTQVGGANDDGTIFKVTSAGTLTTLHSFDSTSGSGAQPVAALIHASNGNFYGTTQVGGANNDGTIFKVTSAGTLTMLHSFNVTDGAVPTAPLIQATDGNFFSTTAFGGSSSACSGGCGTIFEINAKGILTLLHSFALSDGAYPTGGMFQATNGTLYGSDNSGGVYGYGTVFSLSTGLGPFVSLLPTSRKVGGIVGILGQKLTGTTSVSFNGTSASFKVKSETFLTATVPAGATTGYVTVTTPDGTLKSNVPFRVRR